MHVQYGNAALPVLREADITVVGGSLAGISASIALAEGGRSVALIEPRTYLGRDITATLRPWLDRDAIADPARRPRPIQAIIEAHGPATHDAGPELALHPDAVKRCLEDIVLRQEIALLYASLPVAVYPTDDGRAGLVIGNKSGRQVIRATAIIDATETALVSRIAGGTFQAEGGPTARFSRTLEFERVRPIAETALAVPERIRIAGNVVRLHRGYRGPGHLLVELDLDLPFESGLVEAGKVEWEARRRSMDLASWLVSEHPAFGGARYAGSSHELHGRWSPPLAGPDADRAPSGIGPHAWDGAGEPYLALFAGPASNLWRLDAAGGPGNQPSACLDPVAACRWGQRLAELLLADRNARHASAPLQAPLDGIDPADIDRSLSVREPDSPQRGRAYARQVVGPLAVPITHTAEVVVAGGGSSGATAAATAGREGMRTVLLDMNPGPGGTGTYGGVDSYWYGRHVGFAERLAARVNAQHACLNHTGGKWNIEAKAYVLQESADETGVEFLFNTFAIGALTSGDRVRGVLAATRWGPVAVVGEVVIDATGDGDIAAFAGAAFTYGAERTHSVMWFSLAQYATPGLVRNNFTSTVDVSNVEDYTRAILAGRRRGDVLHDHGTYVATRESRHIRGGAVLTLTDQLRHRRWPDVVNIHYSNHDIKGQTESEWLRSGLIPPNLEVEIPYRLVVPEGLDGILVAGKAISVTHDGLPAVRMQVDLENLGGVVALAAAQAVRSGRTPRRIDVRMLQQRLVDEGLLPGDVLTRIIEPAAYTDDELRELVGQLTGETPLHSYSDMHMGELFHDRIPFVEVCSAGSGAVPLLEAAHVGATGPRRVLLAQALAMCGSQAGVPTLVAAIEEAIAGGELPARDSAIRHAGFPPDQGAMPDTAYLLFSLGMVPDSRALPVWSKIAAMLDPTEERLRDRFAGTYSYVDALCHAAERAADPALVPMLQHLRSSATLRDQVSQEPFQEDHFRERQAMLDLGIGSALARCGCPEGRDVLIAYLDDRRALLAERAHSELVDLTGVDHGKDGKAWRSTSTDAAPRLAVRR